MGDVIVTPIITCHLNSTGCGWEGRSLASMHSSLADATVQLKVDQEGSSSPLSAAALYPSLGH